MRQTTVLTILLAAVMSVALFYLNFEVTELEDELDSLNEKIISDRETIHVLKAEWSHLNDVNRLRDLAKRYLEMQPTAPVQVKQAEDFSNIHVIDDPDGEGLEPRCSSSVSAIPFHPLAKVVTVQTWNCRIELCSRAPASKP